MSLISRLDALDTSVVAASPVPWGQWPRARLDVFATMHGDKESIATFEDDLPVGDGDTDEDDDREEARALAESNAALTVSAVNLAPSLSAIARAAVEIVRLERDLAMPRGLGERFPKEELFALESARKRLRAAIDAAEGTA